MAFSCKHSSVTFLGKIIRILEEITLRTGLQEALEERREWTGR